jgi:hypothetical protein
MNTLESRQRKRELFTHAPTISRAHGDVLSTSTIIIGTGARTTWGPLRHRPLPCSAEENTHSHDIRLYEPTISPRIALSFSVRLEYSKLVSSDPASGISPQLATRGRCHFQCHTKIGATRAISEPFRAEQVSQHPRKRPRSRHRPNTSHRDTGRSLVWEVRCRKLLTLVVPESGMVSPAGRAGQGCLQARQVVHTDLERGILLSIRDTAVIGTRLL